MLRSLLLFCLLLGSQIVQAQLSQGGTPYSFNNRFTTSVPVYTTPEIDPAKLIAEDEIDLSYNLPLRFAFGHNVKLSLQNSGTWESLPNGDRIWRLSIHCPDAININFLYENFHLPKGARLYIYDGVKRQVLGAFTEANNKKSGRFATALIHDEIATLEYYEPANVTGQGKIRISQIAHGYRTLDANEGQEKVSGDCQVDVNCEEGEDWQIEKKGVARIVMDGLYLCTGTLVNNTANDCKPLFLTANHCLMGGIKQDAVINPDVSGFVFYWNYEVSKCGLEEAPPEQTTTGGTVLANAGIQETGTHTLLSSDFALIDLDESPRGVYDVYYNGWDASGEQGNTGVGIHHPAGDVKKISTHQVVPEEDGYYWSLFWSPTTNGYSVTEGGSSGSALFRENGLIIGQLFGGGSVNCDDPANDLALYGKLSYSWTNDDEFLLAGDSRRRLMDWLDPIGNGSIRSMNGAYDPCNTKLVYFKTKEASVTEEATTNNDGCRSYADYVYEVGITPYPRNPVTTTISLAGTADEGENLDYELLTTSVTFNNVTNTRNVTLRIYDDAYVESAETIELFLNPVASDGSPVDVLTGANTQTITLDNVDVTPQNHVQTVRNLENPAEDFLGPFGLVHFTVPGSGGMIMSIENLSDHNFGCTEVIVDHAGGTANNSWVNGTSVSKTVKISPEHPASVPVRIQLYMDDGEINAWEWFNNSNLTINDLQLLSFAGSAATANENSAIIQAVTYANYGSDYVFSGELSGLAANTNGITLGKLSNVLRRGFDNGLTNGEKTDMVLAPNVTESATSLRWNLETAGTNQLIIQNLNGQIVLQKTVEAVAGFNSLSIDASSLTAGIYWVRLQAADGKWSQLRLIKS